MRSPLPFRVIPCDEWNAREPKGAIARVGRPQRSLFHHTAGHVPDLGQPGVSYLESCAYARAIQNAHMAPGGLGAPHGGTDSGHNFLITRGGWILEGRHGSLAACRAGVMVASAHCPNQNDQPGVEHEHNGSEAMTPIQRAASVWLYAKLCTWAAVKPSDCAQPHKKFYATACPGSLAAGLPGLRRDVAAALAPVDANVEAWYDKYGPSKKPAWFFQALEEYGRRLGQG